MPDSVEPASPNTQREFPPQVQVSSTGVERRGVAAWRSLRVAAAGRGGDLATFHIPPR